MKKISIIMMALVLVMGMSQCKKNEGQTNINNDDWTFKVLIGNGSNNAKLFFGDPEFDGSIPVEWNAHDIVYLGMENHVIGYLYGAGSAGEYCEFSGNANTINVQFFNLGAQLQPNIQAGNPDQLVFSYENQVEDPAVVSFGTSDVVYSGVNGHYECWQFHTCNALVKFALNTSSDEALTITGVKNQMLFKFDGTYENDDTEGNITTFGTGNVRYATVPVNQPATTGDVYVGANKVGTFRIPSKAELGKCVKGTITLD